MPVVQRPRVDIFQSRPLLSYVKQDRVFDGGNLTATTQPDLSPEGNNATLYTGRYASSDGVADKLINADVSSLNGTEHKLVVRVRPAGTEAAYTCFDTLALGETLTGLTPGVWQEVEFSPTTSWGTLILGYNSGTISYTAADWSDARLVRSSDGEVVARWQLNESSAADLDGYPALDSSGNGYHGTHVGGAGGTGESTILQTAGMDWNRGATLETVLEPDWSSGTDGWNNYAGGAVTSQEASYTDGASVTKTNVLLSSGGETNNLAVVPNPTILAHNEWGRATGWVCADVAGIFRPQNPARWNWSVPVAANTWTYIDVTARVNVGGTQTNLQFNQTSTAESAVRLSGYKVEKVYPSSILIPESDATAGEDCLGNPIANPRLTDRDLNLFGDGEYALIEDDDSLDLTTEATWEFWTTGVGVNDGILKTLWAKDGVSSRAWTIQKTTVGRLAFVIFTSGSISQGQLISPNSDLTCYHIVYNAGTATVYKNGASPTVISSTLGSSIDVTPNDITIGGREINAFADSWDKSISACKIYSKALTADEVLKNFNVQKSKYGL